MAKQNYSVRLSLSDAQVAALAAGFTAVNVVEVIQSVAQDSVCRVADGGLVLTASVLRRIEKVLDKVDDPSEIAEAVEAGAGMEGDNVVVKMTLDPVWVGELKDKAEVLGMSLDVLASELQSQILHQGILYDMTTEVLPVYLTPEQHKAVQIGLGFSFDRPVFGDDVARKLGWMPTVVEEEDIFAGEKAS